MSGYINIISRNMPYLVLLLLSVFFTISCEGNESDEGEGIVTFININSDAPSKAVGETFNFTVTDNLNNEITESTSIYVNGNLIEGNEFTATEEGTFMVKATYETFESDEISISAELIEGLSFRHQILYEDFTGTWCGYCPIAYKRYEVAYEQNENIIFVGVHGPVGSSDPFGNEASSAVEDLYNVTDYPTMYLNRGVEWEYNFNYTDVTLPLSLIQVASKIGIASESTISGNQLNATIRLMFGEDYSGLNLVVYLVEDEIYYDQRNYYNGSGVLPEFYGGAYNVEDYYHQNVLRANPFGVSGVDISSSESTNANVVERNFQYSIPESWNSSNLKLIIFVTDTEGNALNTREVSVNANYSFETI